MLQNTIATNILGGQGPLSEISCSTTKLPKWRNILICGGSKRERGGGRISCVVFGIHVYQDGWPTRTGFANAASLSLLCAYTTRAEAD